MTRPGPLLILLGVYGAGLASGYIAHRPATVTVDHTHEVQAQQQARVDTATSTVGEVVYVQGPERVITRTFACPDGKVSSERIEEKGAAREVETTQAAQVQHAEVRTQVVERDRVVTVPPPRWTASALAGLGLDGRRVYGGEVSIRLIGPLRIGVVATTDRALLGSVGMEW